MLISKTTAAGIILLSALLVQGCGRKGPLFMPQVAAKPVAAEKAQAELSTAIQSQPVPSQPLPNQLIPSQPENKK